MAGGDERDRTLNRTLQSILGFRSPVNADFPLKYARKSVFRHFAWTKAIVLDAEFASGMSSGNYSVYSFSEPMSHDGIVSARRVFMKKTAFICVLASLALVGLGVGGTVQAQQGEMSFFVTSAGLGKGGDLGGLAGADRHCQSLAEAAGATGKRWRAYLSTQGAGAVNARDRIGRGPWVNAKGVVVARDIAELHGANKLTKQTALDEKRNIVNGRGDTPNTHDILTGSQPDGTAFAGSDDRTCGNWTGSGAGAAMLGHSDRTGLDESAPAKSWNSSHPSRGPGGGCSQDDLQSTGGNGLFYCFAAN